MPIEVKSELICSHFRSGVRCLHLAPQDRTQAFLRGRFLAQSTSRSCLAIADDAHQTTADQCADLVAVFRSRLAFRGGAIVFQRDRISSFSYGIQRRIVWVR